MGLDLPIVCWCHVPMSATEFNDHSCSLGMKGGQPAESPAVVGLWAYGH